MVLNFTRTPLCIIASGILWMWWCNRIMMNAAIKNIYMWSQCPYGNEQAVRFHVAKWLIQFVTMHATWFFFQMLFYQGGQRQPEAVFQLCSVTHKLQYVPVWQLGGYALAQGNTVAASWDTKTCWRIMLKYKLWWVVFELVSELSLYFFSV